MWGCHLSLRDLVWAHWPLLLHFPCFGHLSQDFLSLPFCLLGLLCFSQEGVLGGSYGWTSPGPSALFPAVGPPPGPLLITEKTGFPPHWVDSWCHSEPLVLLGGRFFNTSWEDVLGMLHPAGTSASFHLGVVFGGSIASLGVLSVSSSFILVSSSCKASQSYLHSSSSLW